MCSGMNTTKPYNTVFRSGGAIMAKKVEGYIKLQIPANCPLNFQISIGLSSKPRGPHSGSCP